MRRSRLAAVRSLSCAIRELVSMGNRVSKIGTAQSMLFGVNVLSSDVIEQLNATSFAEDRLGSDKARTIMMMLFLTTATVLRLRRAEI